MKWFNRVKGYIGVINEDQEKALGKRKVVINTVSKLYDKLLNICTTQYDNLSEDQ